MTIAYATADDAKQWVDTHDPQAGAQFAELAEVASRRIDYLANRSFAPPGDQDEARIYPLATAWQDGVCQAAIDDLADAPSLVEVAYSEFYDESWCEVPEGDWRLVDPREPGTPYTSIRIGNLYGQTYRQVRVTGRWGWSSVPPPVRTACQLLIARYYRRQSSPLGGETVPGLGGEIIVQAVERDDPDVRALLAPYRRKSAY